MIVYEIVSLLSLSLACGAVSYCAALIRSNNDLHDGVVINNATLVDAIEKTSVDTLEKMEDKVEEFDNITKKASEANNTLFEKIDDIEKKMIALSERMHMMQSSMNMGSSGWKK